MTIEIEGICRVRELHGPGVNRVTRDIASPRALSTRILALIAARGLHLLGIRPRPLGQFPPPPNPAVRE